MEYRKTKNWSCGIIIQMKKLLYIQTGILLAGTLFTWSKLIPQVISYFELYGTFFKIGGLQPNPFLTACLYGSLAMLASFVLSVLLLRNFDPKRQKYLLYLLWFGVAFALAIVSYEFYTFYCAPETTSNFISCSPGVHPLKTPCFAGLLFFLAGALTATQLRKRSQNDQRPAGSQAHAKPDQPSDTL